MSFQVFQAQGLRIYTGDTATVNQYVGLAGELAITTDNKSIRILDGINPGGTPLTTANGAELQGLNIEQLANLLVSAPQDGQALVYEGGKWKNKAVAASGSGGASHVNDLVDVKLTNLQTGEVLSYNASIMKWENKAVAAADHNHDSKYQLKGNYLRDTSNLGEVNDVQITMPADGQSLVYDAGYQKWINNTVESGGVDGITSVNGNIGIGGSPTERLSIKNSTGNGTLDIKTGTVTADSVRIQSGGSATNYLEYRGYLGHVWFVDATERMRIDSNGNIGIGTSSPEVKLDVAGDILINNNSYLHGENSVGGNSKLIGRDSNDTLYIGDSAYSNPTIIQSGNNYVGINTNGSERIRIDSNGNIGIGTSSPAKELHVKGGGAAVIAEGNATGYTEGVFVTKSTEGNIRGGGLAMLSSNTDGSSPVEWYIGRPYSGNDQLIISRHAGSSDMGQSVAQTSNAFLKINNNGVFTNYTPYGYCQIGSQNHSYAHFATDRGHFYFNKNCQAAGGFTTYSDERLKENITVVENAVDALKKIRGVSFTWRTDVDSQERREGKMFGVLAQEVLQIDPEMCEQPEAAIDGDEKYYTFDYSNLTPYFIEAIKEQQVTIESQQSKIDSLEARLAALEAKLS